MNLPYSADAEMSLLSSFLGSPAALSAISELRSDDFYLPFHRELFLAIAGFYERREHVDVITVSDRLGISQDVERSMQLMTIAGYAPTWHRVREYADIVMRHGTARRLISACAELASRAHVQDPGEVLSDARRLMADLEGRTMGGPVRLGEGLGRVLEDIEARTAAVDQTASISLGIASYDALIGPLRPGQLAVVAARPGIGKTALAGCTSLRAAKRGVPVLVFSLEMSFSELAERFLGAHARVSVEQIGRGMGGQSMREILAAAQDLQSLPLWVDDRVLNVGQIASAARSWRVRNQGKRALVVIDYLGLIKPQGRSETRALEVGRMAWGAKMLAKDLACPVLLVAQLNRGNEKDGRKPVLSDLRDSGEIEQHADVVIFPNREPPLEQSGPADLIVAKNRGGKTGLCSCYWNAPLMIFEGLERREEEYADRRYSDAAE
jgi:replicative DNA helicase